MISKTAIHQPSPRIPCYLLYNIKSLTVDENGNVFGKCHAPCSLKTSFEDFEKVHAHCNRYKYINVQNGLSHGNRLQYPIHFRVTSNIFPL
jgi:hypothetical protein